MHPLAAQYMAGLKDLRRWLDNSHLGELLSLYESFAEEERDGAIRRDLAFLPEPLASLTRFFVLGEHDQNAHVPETVRETLCGLGFDFARHRLLRHFDLWIFCERLTPSVDLYHGDDSLGLSRLMLPGRGRCLALCAGVGTQGLLLAQTADSLVAVEKQEKAQLFFWVNALVNSLEERVELRQGDFTAAVKGEHFDHIVCNPPLLPVPREVAYPLAGHGGPDGLDFPRRLLAALPDLLNPGGRCHIIGTMLGGPLGPDLTEWQEVAQSSGIDLLAILPFRSSVSSSAAPMFQSLVSSAVLHAQFQGADPAAARAHIEAAYRRQFSETGATHLYSFFLCANRAAPGSEGQFRFTRHFMDTRRMWTR
jgi:hypothetical protein